MIQVGTNTFGPWNSLIIAEIGQAHDGSLGTAHAFIDAIADAGTDAVKFQTHIAAAESSTREEFRVKFSRQDHTRFDYWKRMEFTEEQWLGLRDHAHDKGLVFLSSPFSFEAAIMLQRLEMVAWKIGSGEVCNTPMLDFLAETGKPILLSTGMSEWAEIDTAVGSIRRHQNPLAVLQCSTRYPTPPEYWGLSEIAEIRNRYDCDVGLSDHSGTIFPSIVAAHIGVSVIEIHTVLSRHQFGPDTPASVTIDELKELVRGIRLVEQSSRRHVPKAEDARELANTKQLFSKSIVTLVSLEAGSVLSMQHLGLRKPGTGIPASRLSECIGRRLNRHVAANEFLSEEMLDKT